MLLGKYLSNTRMAFRIHLDLVFGVGEATCFDGACISGVTRRDLILISASSGRY